MKISQAGVFLALAGSRGRAPVDCEPYLSEAWCDDKEKRKNAHIPDDVTFKTKPELAPGMPERAYSQGLKPDWVPGDCVYGSSEFRNFPERHHQQYVPGVTGQQRLWINFRQVRIDKIVTEITGENWLRHSVGKGAKGERIYDRVCWQTGIKDKSGCSRYVLIRRNVEKPNEHVYYFCYVPENTTTQTLAEAAGKRWNIECCFETARQETGQG